MNHFNVSDETEFISTNVKILHDFVTESIAEHGSAYIGLSGGSTPRTIYTELGKSEEIDWSKVTIFSADERYCDTESSDSNQKMIRESLLAHAEIPANQIIFPDTSLPLEECVSNFADQLSAVQFDESILALGMGPDGHITSLFPPVTDELIETDALAAHTTTDVFAVFDRITITLPPILQSEKILFFLKGEEKKQMWQNMLSSEEGSSRWPAKNLCSKNSVHLVSWW